ncbi:MAG: hypothetical protein IJG81_07860 [Muribaculaceae bacterium]|nr:hypothetical protein [Muribaculaceae bacterium]
MARRTKNDMRKIYSILAIAGIMMTTACSNENNEPANESNVTFTVNLDGIDSRAISDGTTVDQLVFAVYDDQGNEIPALRQNDIQIEDKQATVTTRVAMGQKYSFAFWAQKSGNIFYNTTDLKDVVVSYEGFANDENRDAFTASWAIDKVEGPINETITLYRPFAQVDYVCDIEDWTNLLNSNYKLVGSDLVVDAGAYTHYNVLTGEASQPTETPITLALSNYWQSHQINTFNFCGFVSSKPGETYQDLFTTNDGDKFWLSMNYILASPDETKLGHTSMSIYCWGAAGPTPVEVALDEIPIKRNHRTVVNVSELTRIVKATITIDPSFGGDL